MLCGSLYNVSWRNLNLFSFTNFEQTFKQHIWYKPIGMYYKLFIIVFRCIFVFYISEMFFFSLRFQYT